MKSLKTSSLFRLAALLLISVITICMVGFVTQGWESETPNQPDSGETDENNGLTFFQTMGILLGLVSFYDLMLLNRFYGIFLPYHFEQYIVARVQA